MALIALGANLSAPGDGSPLDTCRRAAALLDQSPGARLIGLSRWFETAPVPASHQPSYVNAIALLSLGSGPLAAPEALLRHLMGIEARFGRIRGVPNAARTLDLDIIAMRIGDRDVVRSFPDPILPHPRAHERAFVLAPWADVASDWRHPVLGMTPARLLLGLEPQAIRPL